MDIGGRQIPLNNDGTVMFSLGSRDKQHEHYSAVDVLQGKVEADAFVGKIVFVGATATGLDDLHSTAEETYMHGVEVHVGFVDNLLNGSFIRIPAWSNIGSILYLLVAGLLASAFFSRGRSLYLIFVMPVVMALIVGGASFVFLYYSKIYISPTPPAVISVSLVWIVVTGLSTYIEEKRLYIRTCQLTDAQAVAIRSMASVAETRDPETGGKHIFRTQNYVKLLGGEYLYGQGEYKGGALTKESIHQMYLSAPLHDVGGKVGIPPDEILLKPGRLTDEEFEIMKTHAILGGEIISRGAEQRLRTAVFSAMVG